MRIVAAISITTGFFLLLLVGDMVLRATISGRMDAFFTSLSTFSIDFAAIMLFGYILQAHVLRRRPLAPYRAMLAFMVLVIVSSCAAYVRVDVRRISLEHVEQVVAKRLIDPSMLPICNALARELIDVEVFRYPGDRTLGRDKMGLGERLVSHCDLMSHINGNSKRRELFVRILNENHMLRDGPTLRPEEVMLSRSQLGTHYTFALLLGFLSIAIFIWAVGEVVWSLRETSDTASRTVSKATAGGVL